MSKKLHVIPDNNEETITLSNACSVYSLKHFRVYSGNNTEFFVVVSQNNNWYMVNANTNVIVKKFINYDSTRCFFKMLMNRGYKIKLIIDEEEQCQ